MKVTELNTDELNELRETYFHQVEDVSEVISSADEISDEFLFEHYGGINFVKEDFWCNI